MAVKAKQRGPWRVISTKTVYRDPWVTVVRDKVLKPDGTPSVHAVFQIKPGAGTVPLDENGNVYLLWQYMYATKMNSFVLAGGGKEKRESYLTAAKRELLEKTGISAKKWTALGASTAFPAHLHAPVQLYLAENLYFQKKMSDKNEPLKIKKMPLARALKLIERGKITHAATVVALLKTARMKNIH